MQSPLWDALPIHISCHDAPVPQKHDQDNLYRLMSNEESLLLLQMARKTASAAASSVFAEK